MVSKAKLILTNNISQFPPQTNSSSNYMSKAGNEYFETYNGSSTPK